MTEDLPNTDAPTEAVATIEAIESLVAESPTTEPAVALTATPTAGGWFWGTGRRKASVARVRIRPGKGEFKVNGRDMTDFFNEERDHKNIRAVLEATNTTGGVEVQAKVHGGGFSGQAGAIILGLGRALMRYDGSLEPTLRNSGFLTRDPRKVERKKPGQPGARKRFQFSKR
jgi:small subunit ribosomal protein S9